MRGKAARQTTSVIFEYEYDAGSPGDGVQVSAGKVTLEFVETDPLLNRETHFLVDDCRTETVEYKTLKAGSTLPTFP